MTVVSQKLWTPQQFAEAITGHCYIFDGDDDVGRIVSILEESGFGDLWDYPIDEIDHIIEQGHKVVLVDCMVWFEDNGRYGHEYRWWQVPESALEKFREEGEYEDFQ